MTKKILPIILLLQVFIAYPNEIKEDDEWLVPSPIHDAVRSNNLGRVKRLCRWYKFVANINSIENYMLDDSEYTESETPFDIAIRKGYTDIVKFFIEKRARFHSLSIMYIDIAFARHLMQWGIKVDDVQSIDGNSLLHLVAFFNHIEIMKFFIENPFFDHTIVNNDGRTAEDIARSKGNLEIAEMLAERPISLGERIVSLKHGGLQYSAIRVINRNGITQKQKDQLPNISKRYITNIKDQSFIEKQRCSIQ